MPEYSQYACHTAPRGSWAKRCMRFVPLLIPLLSFCPSLWADKFFAHSAVGRLGNLESKVRVVITAEVSRGLRGRRTAEAEGELRFFDAEGQLSTVRVRGEGHNGEAASQVNYRVGPGKLNAVFDIESNRETLERIWVQVLETKGSARGTLTFQVTDSGQPVTDVSIFASEARTVNVVPALIRGQDRTGLGVANPTNDDVTFYVVAVDSEENTLVKEVTLPARGQSAQFIDELFPQLAGSEFEGFLQVASDRNLAAVALNQNQASSDVSALETVSADESPVPLPMAAGQVSNLLSSLVAEGGQGSAPLVAGAASALRLDIPEDGLIRSGQVVFRRGNQVITAIISPDGSYLTPELQPGQWEVTVEADGFCPLTQLISFPRAPLDREVVPTDVLDPEWFGDTLAPIGLLKPLRQFEFFFDRQNFGGGIVEQVREAFRLWAEFQLPELGVAVNDGEQRLGGRVRDGRPTGSLLRKVTVRVDPTAPLDRPVAEVFSDPDIGECLGGLIRFHPSCESCPQQVAAQLWLAAFGRRPSEGPLPPGLSDTLTQITGSPVGFSPTPLDILYWKVAQARPPLTRISRDGEVLPDDDPLPPPTQIGPSGRISENPATLGWEQLAGATSYQVRLQDETTASELIDQEVSTTSLRTPILPETHSFRWKVKGLTAEGDSPWSPWMLFDYGNRPPSIFNQAFSVDENSPNGTVVGIVEASDPEGGVLNFVITGGNVGTAFAIDATSGQLRVASSTQLDFETRPQFQLTVRVTDNGGLSDQATVTVNVLDVVESVTLITPLSGAVLDNGCTDQSDGITWFFDWSDVEQTTLYNLFVEFPGAPIPAVDEEVTASEFLFDQEGSFVSDTNLTGWIWRVRAQIGGVWQSWSPERTFDVEPPDTDCPRPDLTITTGEPAAAPSRVTAGGRVTLPPWTVMNQGSAASGFFFDGFYLSADPIITANDTFLDFNSNTSLAPGGSFDWGGPTLTIPANTPAGSYYIGILVDYPGSVIESNEGNNYVSTPLTVVLADFEILDYVIPVPQEINNFDQVDPPGTFFFQNFEYNDQGGEVFPPGQGTLVQVELNLRLPPAVLRPADPNSLTTLLRALGMISTAP